MGGPGGHRTVTGVTGASSHGCPRGGSDWWWQAHTFPQPGKGHDLAVTWHGGMLVVDGATPLGGGGPSGPEVSAFAARVAACWVRAVSVGGSDHRRVLRLVARALDEGPGRWPTGEPSAAVASAWVWDDRMTVVVCGDAAAVAVPRGGEPVLVTDPTVRDLDRVAWERAAGDPGRLVRALRAHRRLANRSDGYTVVSPSVGPERLVDGTRAASRPLGDLEAVMVATDGWMNVWDPFRLVGDLRELVAAACTDPRAPVRRMRALEDSDPGLVRWPRIGVHDDAAVACATSPGFVPAR